MTTQDAGVSEIPEEVARLLAVELVVAFPHPYFGEPMEKWVKRKLEYALAGYDIRPRSPESGESAAEAYSGAVRDVVESLRAQAEGWAKNHCKHCRDGETALNNAAHFIEQRALSTTTEATETEEQTNEHIHSRTD